MQTLPRAHIFAALRLELSTVAAVSGAFNRLSLHVHGATGQLPNLDLVSVTLANARLMLQDFSREHVRREKGPDVDFGAAFPFLASMCLAVSVNCF
jgi:hypothetical protein